MYLIDIVITKHTFSEDAAIMPDSRCLNDGTKRVNNDISIELCFELVKSARSSCNQYITYGRVLNDFFSQIDDLSKISTGSGDSVEIMANVIAAVHTVKTFSRVWQNVPGKLQEPISALHFYALEAYRQVLTFYEESLHMCASYHV